MKDTEIKELKKYEYVSSVMTIAPVLNIDREKWVPWESYQKSMMVFMYASIPSIQIF